jgi:hypothetical protein
VSEDQLVGAYVRGDISRRIFIRRLLAVGVGASAAVAYGKLLTPEARAANRLTDLHEVSFALEQKNRAAAEHTRRTLQR